MSWAEIAKANAPPPSEQPQPNQDLLLHHSDAPVNVSDSHVATVDSFEEVDQVQADLAKAQSTSGLYKDVKRNPAPAEGSEEPHKSEVAPTNEPSVTEVKSSKSTAGSAAATNTTSSSSNSNNNNMSSSSSSAQDKGAKAGRKIDEAEQKASDFYNSSAEHKGATIGRQVDKAEENIAEAADEVEGKAKEVGRAAKRDAKELKDKAAAEIDRAENAMAQYWEQVKDIVLRPGTLGGLMGVANVGLLSFLGYSAYVHKDLPTWNRNYVGAAIAGTVGLFAVEGLVTEQYTTTEEGRQEVARAKREGSKLYLQAKESILRPKVAGGLLGVVNVAVLGAVGYFAYENRNRPWDPKHVGAIVAGLISLSAAEGLATDVYAKKELPDQKRKGNY